MERCPRILVSSPHVFHNKIFCLLLSTPVHRPSTGNPPGYPRGYPPILWTTFYTSVPLNERTPALLRAAYLLTCAQQRADDLVRHAQIRVWTVGRATP